MSAAVGKLAATSEYCLPGGMSGGRSREVSKRSSSSSWVGRYLGEVLFLAPEVCRRQGTARGTCKQASTSWRWAQWPGCESFQHVTLTNQLRPISELLDFLEAHDPLLLSPFDPRPRDRFPPHPTTDLIAVPPAVTIPLASHVGEILLAPGTRPQWAA